MKVVLSIAGSDSGAGAGIQADLKTLSLLGTYGCTAITALTAQNTRKVSKIYRLPPNIVEEQIRSVITDMSPAAVKVGMVHSKEIIEVIVRALTSINVPIVIDPILAAGTGVSLLRDDALDSFKSQLIPLATLLTPNRMEAEKLSKMSIRSKNDGIVAAKRLRQLGSQNVLLKGGHFGKKAVVDILLTEDGNVTEIVNPRVEIDESHGSGCNLSAAAAAYLAQGVSLGEACLRANRYVHEAIKNSIKVGKGFSVTNPLTAIYKDAMRYKVLNELQAAVDRLISMNGFYQLIPETQSNFAYALEDASTPNDIAAITGRIARAGDRAMQVSRVEFGASKHMALALLAYMSINPWARAVINIRLDKRVLSVCKSLFQVSSYDRSKEPPDTKRKEGSTVYWGTTKALGKNKNADVIYHEGDIGKEPMITIFGRSPEEVANKINLILEKF